MYVNPTICLLFYYFPTFNFACAIIKKGEIYANIFCNKNKTK